MAIVGNVEDRILAIMNSPAVTVRPVGDVNSPNRGILLVADAAIGWLSAAVKAAFPALVIAVALVAAAPSHAAGVGHDSVAYGQSQAQAQVMQHDAASGNPGVELKTGGATRVAPSNGQFKVLQGPALDLTVGSVMRSAGGMRLQVDANKITNLLSTGVGERNGMFVGKIVGVDMARGLVYQDAGRGKGVVYASNTLSRIPTIGEVVSVKMQNGRGAVDTQRDQGINRGRG